MIVIPVKTGIQNYLFNLIMNEGKKYMYPIHDMPFSPGASGCPPFLVVITGIL
jgi:hypothetical protein